MLFSSLNCNQRENRTSGPCFFQKVIAGAAVCKKGFPCRFLVEVYLPVTAKLVIAPLLMDEFQNVIRRITEKETNLMREFLTMVGSPAELVDDLGQIRRAGIGISFRHQKAGRFGMGERIFQSLFSVHQDKNPPRTGVNIINTQIAFLHLCVVIFDFLSVLRKLFFWERKQIGNFNPSQRRRCVAEQLILKIGHPKSPSRQITGGTQCSLFS